MKILAFTISRANTEARGKMFMQTIAQARDTAGYEFDWHIHCEEGTLAHDIAKTSKASGLIQIIVPYTRNVGQHIPFNSALEYAKQNGYDFLLRLDDDCEFLSKRWLAKLIRISEKFEHKALLTPAVRGLRFAPPRSLEREIGDFKIEFLLEAIGGICRLHPVEVLTNPDDPYISDVRLPLGSGDATGIGAWCQRNIVPMIWCKNVRVLHATKEQEKADEEHFSMHNLLQRIPYIPAMDGLEIR